MNEKVKYFHKRGTGKNKSYTIASVYDEENKVLLIGKSICSPKDTFKKKIGRTISYGRAIKNPLFILNMVDSPYFEENVQLLFSIFDLEIPEDIDYDDKIGVMSKFSRELARHKL